ncbi:hypothetical protein CLV58_113136 [Spirosoma oryzae]|uniref:Uncharacterized protein n=1 Tax=Spirosoma oryzae TaxID=1469603 RepID=A0A2T0SRG1_9BACT|nr:hypothetical protein CLV58_113136 [Spirosoma oryzae]
MNNTTTIHRFTEGHSEHLLAYISQQTAESQQRETKVLSMAKRCCSRLTSPLPPIITLLRDGLFKLPPACIC